MLKNVQTEKRCLTGFHLNSTNELGRFLHPASPQIVREYSVNLELAPPPLVQAWGH